MVAPLSDTYLDIYFTNTHHNRTNVNNVCDEAAGLTEAHIQQLQLRR